MEKIDHSVEENLLDVDQLDSVQFEAAQSSNAGMFEYLVERFGEAYLRIRLQKQIKHADKIFDRGRRLLHIENSEWIMVILYWILRLTGTYNWGNRNLLDIQTVENEVFIDNLPKAFDGYRILHLSDLHLDIDTNLKYAITEAVKGVEYDLAVNTGDYRASTGGSYQMAVDETIAFMPILKKPVYCILGNHDFIEFVKPLEDEAGMTFLINESVPIEKDGEVIWLTGVDDPHLYQLDDFEGAYANVPEDAVRVLLSHAPENYASAAEYNVDLMLAGHTHGGQICLPGRIPILVYGDQPRRMINGAWTYGDKLQGYTSPGTGGCGVPVRYFCPPEITIHTLRCKN
ncbi:MAG: metallophosphoesterase [Chloroflexota bacterium]